MIHPSILEPDSQKTASAVSRPVTFSSPKGPGHLQPSHDRSHSGERQTSTPQSSSASDKDDVHPLEIGATGRRSVGRSAAQRSDLNANGPRSALSNECSGVDLAPV